MRSQLVELPTQLWMLINRLSAHMALNFLDDPAILAMAFC